MVALLNLLSRLISRGGEPQQDGSALIYPLRPGFRLLTLCFFPLGYFLAKSDLASLTEPPHLPSFTLCIGIFVFLAGFLVFAPSVRLDEEGLHHRTLFGKPLHLRWDEFDHVQHFVGTRLVSSMWYFFDHSGRRRIYLSEMLYNTPYLLQQIRQRVPLPERPYQSVLSRI